MNKDWMLAEIAEFLKWTLTIVWFGTVAGFFIGMGMHWYLQVAG